MTVGRQRAPTDNPSSPLTVGQSDKPVTSSARGSFSSDWKKDSTLA